MTTKRLSKLAVSSLALIFAACGGGGSSANQVVPIANLVESNLSWTQGRFDPSASFKNRCENPRANSTDVNGSYLHEKHWLRSWSNETYLWYDEIPDIDPASSEYPLPTNYFEILKTNATTPSGNPRDRFHDYTDTAAYAELVNSGASASYGARFRLLDTTPPDRQAVIAFVEAGSPAAAAGLTRGTEIISVDGAAIADGNADTLNAGLFPGGAGESHTFEVRDPGSTTTRSVTIVSDIVSSIPVHTTSVETLGDGTKVGYILYNSFNTSTGEEQLFDTINAFDSQGVQELVLDLRYNGGGWVDITSELAYMIAGPANTNGRTFMQNVYNDKITPDSPLPFYSTAQGNHSLAEGTQLPSLDLNKLYVLSTSRTCSASELIVNALDGIDIEVVLIGTTTCGKPYGFRPTDNCGTTYFTIQFRAENAKGFGDYADGFSPSENGQSTVGVPFNGCVVGDDFSNQLGDPSESLFNAAITHIETGSCPTTSAKASPTNESSIWIDSDGPSLLDDPRLKKMDLIENSLKLHVQD